MGQCIKKTFIKIALHTKKKNATMRLEEERIFMKSKTKTILKILVFFLIILCLIVGGVVVYLFLADIESVVPEEIKDKIEIIEETYEGRKVFSLTPKEKETESTVIFYFHGGSYVAEASREHWYFLADLVEDTKATIIMPDYPLTPKYNYKDVFAMIEPLYEEIIAQENTENFIVMGDSAGGGMALALCEKLGEEGKQKPDKLILISPWLDVRLENKAIDAVEEKDKQLNREALKVAGISYAGEDGMESFLVNPILGNPETLKDISITIFTGTYDILNPDVHTWLEKVGNTLQIDLKEYEGATHIWLLDRSENKTEQAEEAYQALLESIGG